MRDSVDEKLAAALYDVPVPQGLADRLLASLAAECLAADAELPSRWLPESISRRRVYAGSALMALAVGLLVAVWLGSRTTESLSESFALNEAIQSFGTSEGESGVLVAERPAPADYPFSSAMLRPRGARWRVLDSFLGRRGVVYDMPRAAGRGAALYVVDAGAIQGFDGAPALRPFTTAGCCASAWQEGSLLYVLVVQGDPATYRAYLSLPHGPVAWLRALDPLRTCPQGA